MKNLKITIQQKEKNSLPLTHIQAEIETMYGETISTFTRDSLNFLTLIFFLTIRKNNKNSIFYELLEQNIQKLQKFQQKLQKLKHNLKKSEYAALLQDFDLKNLFKFDLFLLLVSTLQNAADQKQFQPFLDQNPEILTEIQKINRKFGQKLTNFLEIFQNTKITDNRGLTKHITHLIDMRTRHKLDFLLQSDTELSTIRHNSPLWIEFVQKINHDLIFIIWEKLKLADYTAALFGKPGHIFNHNIHIGQLGRLAAKWFRYKTARKIAINEAKETFLHEKENPEFLAANQKALKLILNSVTHAAQNHKTRIETLKTKLQILENQPFTLENKKNWLVTEKQLQILENLQISVK